MFSGCGGGRRRALRPLVRDYQALMGGWLMWHDLHPAAVSSERWEGASMRAVGPSRFWVAGRRVPEPNEDAVRLAPAFAYLPHAFKEAGWQADERQRLQAAILAAVKVCCRLPPVGAALGGRSLSGATVKRPKPGCQVPRVCAIHAAVLSKHSPVCHAMHALYTCASPSRMDQPRRMGRAGLSACKGIRVTNHLFWRCAAR